MQSHSPAVSTMRDCYVQRTQTSSGSTTAASSGKLDIAATYQFGSVTNKGYPALLNSKIDVVRRYDLCARIYVAVPTIVNLGALAGKQIGSVPSGPVPTPNIPVFVKSITPLLLKTSMVN